MHRSEVRYKVVLSTLAREDIRSLLVWSVTSFGARAASRYRAFLNQAFHDLASDPTRPGSRTHPALVEGARLYHLSMSRLRGQNQVKAPRHQIVFRVKGDRLEIARVLHDSNEVIRHLPDDFVS